MNSYGEPQYGCEQGAMPYGWGCEPGAPCHCQPHSCDESMDSPCGCELHVQTPSSLRQSQLMYGCEAASGTRSCGYEYPPPPPQQHMLSYCYHHDAEAVADRPCDCNACPRSPKHLSRDDPRPCECSLPSESAVVPLQFAPQQQTLEYPCDCASHVVDDTSRCCYPADARYACEQQPPYTSCPSGGDGSYVGPSRALQDDRPSSTGPAWDPRFTSDLVPPHTPVTRKVRFFEEIINNGSKIHNQVLERKVSEVCEVVEERSYNFSTLDIEDEEEFTSSFQNRQGFTTFSTLANESGATSQTATGGLQTHTSTGIIQRRPLESNLSSPLNTEATDCMIVPCDDHSIDCEDPKKFEDLQEKKYKLEVSVAQAKHEVIDSDCSRNDDPKVDVTSIFHPTDGANGETVGDGGRSCLNNGGMEHVTRLCTRLQSVTLNTRPREDIVDDASAQDTLLEVQSEQARVVNTDKESVSRAAAASTQVVLENIDITENDALDPLENEAGVENSRRGPVATSAELQKQSPLPLLELQEGDVASQNISVDGLNNDMEKNAPMNKQDDQVDRHLGKQPVAGHKQQNIRALKNAMRHEAREIRKPNAPGKSVKRSHDDVVPTFRNLDKPKDPCANDGQNQYKYKNKMNFANIFESDLDTDDKDIHIVYQRKGNSTERKEIEKLNHDVTELKIKLNELQFRQQTLDPVPVPKKTIRKTVKKLSPRKRTLKKRKVTSLGARRSGSNLDETCASGKNSPNMHNLNAENSGKKTPEASIPHINTVENNVENSLSKKSEIPSSLIGTLPDKTDKDLSICVNGKSYNARNEGKQKPTSIQKICQVGPTNSLPKPNKFQQTSTTGKRDECGKEKKRRRESNESNASLERTAIVLSPDLDDVPCGEEWTLATSSDHLVATNESNEQDNDPEINSLANTLSKNECLQNSSTIAQMENEQQPVELDRTSLKVSTNVVDGCNKFGGSSKVSTGISKSFQVESITTEKQTFNKTASKHSTSESSSSDVQTFVVNDCGKAQTEKTLNKMKPILQTIPSKPQCILIDIAEENSDSTGKPVIVEDPKFKSSGKANPAKVQHTNSGTPNGTSSNKQHLPGQPVLVLNRHSSTSTFSSQQKRGPAASKEHNAANVSAILIHQEHLKQQVSNSSKEQRQTNAESQPLGHKTQTNAMQRSGFVSREQLARRIDSKQTVSSIELTNTIMNPLQTPMVTTIPENQSNEIISYVTNAFSHPYGVVSVQNPNIQFVPPNSVQVPISYIQPPPLILQTPQQFSQYLSFQPQNHAQTRNYENISSSVDIDGNVFMSTPSYTCNPSFNPVLTPHPHLNNGARFTRLLQEQQQLCAQTSSSTGGKSVSNKTVPSKRDVDTLKYPGSIFMASGPHPLSSPNRGFVEQDHSYAVGATHGFTQIVQPPLNAPIVNANCSGPSAPINQSLPSPALNMTSINVNCAGRYQQTNHPRPPSAVNMRGMKPTSQQNPLPSAVNTQGGKSTYQQTNNPIQQSVGNMQSGNINSQPINRPLQPTMQGRDLTSQPNSNPKVPSATNMHDRNSTLQPNNNPLQLSHTRIQSRRSSSQPNSNPKLPSATNMHDRNPTLQPNNNPLQLSDTSMQSRRSSSQPNNKSLLPSVANMQGNTATTKPTSNPLQPSAANMQGVNSASQLTSHPKLPSGTNMEGMKTSSLSTHHPLQSLTAALMQDRNLNCSGHYEAGRKSIPSSAISKRENKNSISQQKASQPIVSPPQYAKCVSSSSANLCISLPTHDKASDESHLKKTNGKIPSLTLNNVKSNNSARSKKPNQSSISSLTVIPPRVNLNRVGRSKSLHRYKPPMCVESARSNISSNSEPNKKSLPSSSSNRQRLHSKSSASFEAICNAPLDLMRELQISDVANTRKKAPTQLMLSAMLKRQGISFKGDASCKPKNMPTHLASLLSDNDKNVITLSSSSETSLGEQVNKSTKANNVLNIQQSTGKEDDSLRNPFHHNATRKIYQIQSDVGKNVTMPRVHTYKTTACDKSNLTTERKEDSRLSEPNLSPQTTSSFSSETNMTLETQTRPQSQSGGTFKSHVLLTPTKRNALHSHAPKPDLVSTVHCIEKGTYSSEKYASADKSFGKERRMHLPVKAIPIRDPSSTNRKVIPQVVGKEGISTEQFAVVHSRDMSKGERQDKSDVIRTQIRPNTRGRSEREGAAGVILAQHQGDCDRGYSRERVVKSKVFQRDCDRTNSKDGVVKPKLNHRNCERANLRDGVVKVNPSNKYCDRVNSKDGVKAKLSQNDCNKANSRDVYSKPSQGDCDKGNSKHGVVNEKLSHIDCDRANSRDVSSKPSRGDCDRGNSKDGAVKAKLSHKDCDRANSRDVSSKPSRGDCYRGSSKDGAVNAELSELSHKDCDRANSRDVYSKPSRGDCNRGNSKDGVVISKAFQGVCDGTNSRDGGSTSNASQGDCRSTILPTSKKNFVKKRQIKSKEPHLTRSDSRVQDKQWQEKPGTLSSTSNKVSFSPRKNRLGRRLSDNQDDSADGKDEPSRRRSQSPNKTEGRLRSSWGYWYNRRGISQQTIEHMDELCTEIWNDGDSVEFRHDVDFKNVVDYVSIVKQPLCLTDIRSKLKRYAYRTVDQFVHDLRRLIFNSRLYNQINSELEKVTTSLEVKIDKLVYDMFECNFSHVTGDPLETETNPDLQYTFFTGL